MTQLRILLVAGIALPLAAVALTTSQGAPVAEDRAAAVCQPGTAGQPPELSREDRVTCAELAVERARRQLERVTARSGDTSEADQRLANAEAELIAAQGVLAAAGDTATQEDVAAATDDETAPLDEQQAATAPSDEQSTTQEQAASPPATPLAQREGSTVELQLEKQGDGKEIDRIRMLRDKLRSERNDSSPEIASKGPTANNDGAVLGPVLLKSGDRSIIRLGGQVVIRQTEEEETNRLLLGARDATINKLPNGLSRSVITRQDGTKIVTTRDSSGQIVNRVRVDGRGKELVMIDDAGYHQGQGSRSNGLGKQHSYQFDLTLPPLRIRISQDLYVVETRRASRRQIEQALMAPPVERAERLYSLDEIRYSQRLRSKLRRIDVDTITFDFGSAAINPGQFDALTELGKALGDFIANNPSATIMVEGHTDAVGSDYANLLLSDRRAEAVAVALTGYFDIPPENLVTQGYGEQFLKVDTQLPARENRRVSLLNISGLIQNVSQ
jgi:outer membrane protein OmpA-like peptidoglycan-associated protein